MHCPLCRRFYPDLPVWPATIWPVNDSRPKSIMLEGNLPCCGGFQVEYSRETWDKENTCPEDKDDHD